MVPNSSFFPPISLIAPASAERFNKQLGARPIEFEGLAEMSREWPCRGDQVRYRAGVEGGFARANEQNDVAEIFADPLPDASIDNDAAVGRRATHVSHISGVMKISSAVA